MERVNYLSMVCLFQDLEKETCQCEGKYRDLIHRGEDLLVLDPHLPGVASDIASLQIGWEELQRLLGNRRNQLNTAKILQVHKDS